LDLKPLYTYDEVARLERRPLRTIQRWISEDRKLPEAERRFPGAAFGEIPLADLKARYSMTNEDIAAMDLPELDEDSLTEADIIADEASA
jgi:hypothetical protein